jgi:hypothetical protein
VGAGARFGLLAREDEGLDGEDLPFLHELAGPPVPPGLREDGQRPVTGLSTPITPWADASIRVNSSEASGADSLCGAVCGDPGQPSFDAADSPSTFAGALSQVSDRQI